MHCTHLIDRPNRLTIILLPLHRYIDPYPHANFELKKMRVSGNAKASHPVATKPRHARNSLDSRP